MLSSMEFHKLTYKLGHQDGFRTPKFRVQKLKKSCFLDAIQLKPLKNHQGPGTTSSTVKFLNGDLEEFKDPEI